MALNFFLAASLNQLWSMINGLQLTTHLPLFYLKVPANSEFFLGFMIEVATFDPLPEEAIWAVFTLPDSDPYSDSFNSCGYSFIHLVENFGTGTVLIHLCLFAAVICLTIRCLKFELAQRIVQHPRFTNM